MMMCRRDDMNYLAELLQDKRSLHMFPKQFKHIERLVDQEIVSVRSALFECSFIGKLDLPEPIGDPVLSKRKVYVPVEQNPTFNFIGRILGPRGMTAKQLEQETGCKIMIRGRGSIRDNRFHDKNTRPTFEEMNDRLHVLIQCEDTPNRANYRLDVAVECVSKLLQPQNDLDDLKKKQLLELSLVNGTFKQQPCWSTPIKSTRPRSTFTYSMPIETGTEYIPAGSPTSPCSPSSPMPGYLSSETLFFDDEIVSPMASLCF